MPLFNDMYFDQKWSLWDAWLFSVPRAIRGYLITAGRRGGKVVTAGYLRANLVTAKKRRSHIISTGG